MVRFVSRLIEFPTCAGLLDFDSQSLILKMGSRCRALITASKPFFWLIDFYGRLCFALHNHACSALVDPTVHIFLAPKPCFYATIHNLPWTVQPSRSLIPSFPIPLLQRPPPPPSGTGVGAFAAALLLPVVVGPTTTATPTTTQSGLPLLPTTSTVAPRDPLGLCLERR